MSVSNTAARTAAYKRTILRFGIGFVIVMLLLTFFSGTLNNIALAQVGVTSPQTASLQKVITADGSFAAKEIDNVMAGAAGKVAKVLVNAGDVVKAGDPLVQMDMTDLKNQIATEQNSLTKMLNNQAKSAITTSPDYTQQKIKIANDKTAVTNAQSDLTAAQNAQAALAEKAKTDPTVTQAQLDAAAQLVTTKQTALTNAQNQLKVDQNSYNHSLTQDANSKKQSDLDKANSAIDLKTEQDKIASLQQQLADNEVIKAPVSGRIQTISVQAGSSVNTTQAVMTELNTGSGLTFSFDVSNDNAELMAQGDQLDIHLTGSTDSVSSTITAIKNSTANPGQMMTVVLDADTQGVINKNVQPNQKGDIRYSVQTNSYNTTLPNGAVREDSSGYFVLVVQQKTTPLGKNYVASRVAVTVVDSDSYRTAVSGGVSQRDQVINSSDKSVSDGDTVRLAAS